ncbi:hypothetical protein GCM10028802_35690 [Terrabacter terrigena]
MGQQITSVVTSPDGRLEITFGAARISVDADDRFESWELSGPHGAKVVCTAGGKLVTWSPREPA